MTTIFGLVSIYVGGYTTQFSVASNEGEEKGKTGRLRALKTAAKGRKNRPASVYPRGVSVFDTRHRRGTLII